MKIFSGNKAGTPAKPGFCARLKVALGQSLVKLLPEKQRDALHEKPKIYSTPRLTMTPFGAYNEWTGQMIWDAPSSPESKSGK